MSCVILQAAYEKAKRQEQSSSSRNPGGMPGGFPGGMPEGFPGDVPGGVPGNVDFSKILNVSTSVLHVCVLLSLSLTCVLILMSNVP